MKRLRLASGKRSASDGAPRLIAAYHNFASSPRVSVLMPVHNGERFISAAIKSIAQQTLGDFEFIIVDDGSTDSTPSIIQHFARIDRRIRTLRLCHSGISAALEAGRAIARAPLLARMDCDDVAMPNRLANQIAYLGRHPNVVAVGGQVQLIDEHEVPLKRGRFPIEPSACRSYFEYGAPFCHPAVMMRKSALEYIGGYRSQFEPAEDLDLWLRLSRIGDLANLDEIVLHYRVHAATVTRRGPAANAAASAIAYMIHLYGDDVLPSYKTLSARNLDWQTIELALPAQFRLHARIYYLRSLILNEGINEPASFDFFLNSLPELVSNSKFADHRELLAFMTIRGAYQMARLIKPVEAAKCLALGCKHNFSATTREAFASLGARLLARHQSRAVRALVHSSVPQFPSPLSISKR